MLIHVFIDTDIKFFEFQDSGETLGEVEANKLLKIFAAQLNKLLGRRATLKENPKQIPTE